MRKEKGPLATSYNVSEGAIFLQRLLPAKGQNTSTAIISPVARVPNALTTRVDQTIRLAE